MPSAVVTRRTTKFSTCRASSEGILRFSAQFRNILLCRGPGYLWVGRRSYIILHPLQWWSNGEQCLTCECEGDVIPLVCKSPILWALINAADGDKETHHDGSWLIISKRGQRRQTPAHEEAESGHQVARWDSHGMVLFQNSHLSFQCYFKVTDIPHSTFTSASGGPLRLRHNVWTPGWFGWKDDWWDIHECSRATQRFSPVRLPSGKLT